MKTQTIALKTFRGIGKNGRPLSFSKGDTLKPNQIKNLLPRHKDYVIEKIVPTTPKSKMPKGEKLLIADLYNQYADPVNQSDNRDMIISDYLDIYPTRPVNSIIFYICQCKHVDNYYDSKGFTSVDSNIITFLNTTDPDRYMNNKDYQYCKSFS